MKLHFTKFSIISLLFLCVSNTVFAQILDHKLPNGLRSNADYHRGDTLKPAVVILHGFLQTRNYLTVQNLFTAVSDAGYSVLTPNLSLGISNRKKSLPCEAIHNHTMSQDIAEIDYWITWLEQQGHHEIYLIGHSFGSLQLLVYSNSKIHKTIKKLIATSLIHIEKSNDNTLIKNYLEQARQQVANKNKQLHKYPISYCSNYTSPAENYISYAKWTKDNIIVEINKLNIPMTMIFGSKDIRVNKNWITRLQKTNLNLIIIKGANHFFDASHEFDLSDNVLNELSSN